MVVGTTKKVLAGVWVSFHSQVHLYLLVHLTLFSPQGDKATTQRMTSLHFHSVKQP